VKPGCFSFQTGKKNLTDTSVIDQAISTRETKASRTREFIKDLGFFFFWQLSEPLIRNDSGAI
jgi:hypothetical protein